MAVTPASFKIRFPEFGSVLDARIQLFLDDAGVLLNEAFWGAKYDLGTSYLTAHYLTIGTSTENGASGSIAPVSSRGVDGTSVSYAQVTSGNVADSFYASTVYGQRYLALRRSLGSGACSV